MATIPDDDRSAGATPALTAGARAARPDGAPFDPYAPMSHRAPVIILLALTAMLLAVSTWYWWPGAIRTTPVAVKAGAGSPAGAPPKIAPVEYFAISPDEARQRNLTTPFATGDNPAAAPFLFAGSAEDRMRAQTCLASAAYYEAGDDVIGQQAVVQVVLNRMRHPAFPKTICGVVFQGTERASGCQFTFTCDGALNRVADRAIWQRATLAADMALSGFVFAPVGVATHYHTDWVLPRWSPQMDKIAQVHTHLFFRWRGDWGRPGAFRGVYAGGEVMDPRLNRYYVAPPAQVEPATVAPNGAPGVAADAPLLSSAAAKLSPGDMGGNAVRLADDARGQYVVQLDPAAFPGDYAVLAWKLCRDAQPCRVAGYRDAAHLPTALPLAGSDWRANLTFLFEKTGAGDSRTYWNCAQIAGRSAAQCLPDVKTAAAGPMPLPAPANGPGR